MYIMFGKERRAGLFGLLWSACVHVAFEFDSAAFVDLRNPKPAPKTLNHKLQNTKTDP